MGIVFMVFLLMVPLNVSANNNANVTDDTIDSDSFENIYAIIYTEQEDNSNEIILKDKALSGNSVEAQENNEVDKEDQSNDTILKNGTVVKVIDELDNSTHISNIPQEGNSYEGYLNKDDLIYFDIKEFKEMQFPNDEEINVSQYISHNNDGPFNDSISKKINSIKVYYELDEISLISFITQNEEKIFGYINNNIINDEDNIKNDESSNDDNSIENNDSNNNNNNIENDTSNNLVDNHQENYDSNTNDGDIVNSSNNENKKSEKNDNLSDEAKDKEYGSPQMRIVPFSQTNTTNFQGVALKEKTIVYSKTDTKSNVLKSYNKGHVLKYKSFNSNWYQATVLINGKKKTGYINKSHVLEITEKHSSIQGIANKIPTNIYSSNSISSSVVKSYSRGTILKFNPIDKNWYKATVYVGGKKKIGFIAASDIELGNQSSKSLYGIGLKSPTKVYKTASTKSAAWKSYTRGTVLKYTNFSKNWYKAIIYVNGQQKTGYILKSHTESADLPADNITGIGLNSPTKVFKIASTHSTAWKSYSQGTILKYTNFSKNWYKAIVYVNGKKKTGYILKTHVENKLSSSKTEYGIGLKSPTNVYKKASTKSGVWKAYARGKELKYKTFSKNWYEATVIINGVKTKGYINKSHVGNRATTQYNQTFNQAVDTHFNRLNIYGHSKESIKTYLDPSKNNQNQHILINNFVSNNEIENILKNDLKNRGILKGTEKSFLNGAKNNNINVFYLVAHARVETGNGNSILSQGVKVGLNSKGNPEIQTNSNKNKLSKVKTVYNMFGIAAFDKTPMNGSIAAYNRGWDTPGKSIEGGAKWISDNYINSSYNKQNTLYKMIWHPLSPGEAGHSYATDIRWPNTIGSIMGEYISKETNPNYYYDIPKYK